MNGTFNGLGLNLGNLSRLSDAETRSLSAENPTGAKGQGGRHVDPNHGCSRDLGTGWKVRPCVGVGFIAQSALWLIMHTYWSYRRSIAQKKTLWYAQMGCVT